MTAPQVLYIVEKFPTFSETFIHDEIAHHVASGLKVKVVVLTGPAESAYPLSRCTGAIQEAVTYLGIPASKPRLAFAGLAESLRRRFLPKLLKAVLKEKLSLREASIGAIIASRFPGEAILHCHFGNIGRIGLAVQLMSPGRKTLLVTFHAHELTRRWFLPLATYYAPLFRSNAQLLPISDHWRKTLVEAGADATRTKTHHMGVRPFAGPERPLQSEGVIKSVLVGRMVDKKGHADAVEAMSLLTKRGVRMECDFVGGGPGAAEIAAMIRAYGLADQIKMRGALLHHEALALVDAADVFLLPSRTAADGDMEGIPVSLMEAMARGIPVVSTRHSGIPELIEDGLSGLLVEERSPQQLADALERLASDPGLRARLGSEGKRRVEEQFNSLLQAERLRLVYDEAVANT